MWYGKDVDKDGPPESDGPLAVTERELQRLTKQAYVRGLRDALKLVMRERINGTHTAAESLSAIVDGLSLEIGEAEATPLSADVEAELARRRRTDVG